MGGEADDARRFHAQNQACEERRWAKQRLQKKAQNKVRGGLRQEQASCDGGGGADGAQDTVSKRIKAKERQALCVLLRESYLLNPKDNQVLCEGAQQDRRNMMSPHRGCGLPELKLHSRPKNPPTHLFLCLEEYLLHTVAYYLPLPSFQKLTKTRCSQRSNLGHFKPTPADTAPWWSSG